MAGGDLMNKILCDKCGNELDYYRGMHVEISGGLETKLRILNEPR
jgi:hypothetical protein